MTSEFLVCACSSDEHTLRFIHDEETNDFWTSVYLNPKPWYKRVWVAVKYVFGYQSKYGAWDCFLLDPKDANRMITILAKTRGWK
jgi:hypothetical protein